jgi:Holliday junction resolvase RusA-like endonuclease
VTAEISFDVRGMPVAQGSPRAFVAGGRAIVSTEANRPHGSRATAPLGAWRNAIATEARDTIGAAPLLAGPVFVGLTFRMPRPSSHFLPANGRRPTRELRLDAPLHPTSAPDADKLARAALDALSAVVFGDDAQVAHLSVLKRFVDEVEGPGVRVVVRPMVATR